MSFLPLFLLAVSLSSDAFAASLARGGAARLPGWGAAIGSGAVFGAAEGLMCFGGWLVAGIFAQKIAAVDHWIALLLLGVIGARMVREGLSGEVEAEADAPRRGTLGGTVLTALGTSVDSAAVGAALALSGTGAISALVIGLTSFIASTIGFRIGPWVGARLGRRAEIAGGALLIAIGVSIFVSHVFG